MIYGNSGLIIYFYSIILGFERGPSGGPLDEKNGQDEFGQYHYLFNINKLQHKRTV